jgi:ABC-type molybdate transport system substrate-binding protein
MKPVSLEATMMKRIGELNAENARLKALTVEMDKTINISQSGCRELKAEVERLTFVDDFIVITRASIKQLIEEGVQNKSGEYEERYLIRVNKDEYIKVLKHMSEFWEAAKEGKPSV